MIPRGPQSSRTISRKRIKETTSLACKRDNIASCTVSIQSCIILPNQMRWMLCYPPVEGRFVCAEVQRIEAKVSRQRAVQMGGRGASRLPEWTSRCRHHHSSPRLENDRRQSRSKSTVRTEMTGIKDPYKGFHLQTACQTRKQDGPTTVNGHYLRSSRCSSLEDRRAQNRDRCLHG